MQEGWQVDEKTLRHFWEAKISASKLFCTKIISWCESPDLLTRYLSTGGQYPELYLQGTNYENVSVKMSVWQTDKVTEAENAVSSQINGTPGTDE